MLRPTQTICLIILLFGLISCGGNKSKSESIWGIWTVQSAKIEDGGIFPPSEKLQMELRAKGQVWQFNPDSTITMKENINAKSSGSVPFSITNENGHTLLVMGKSSVVELSNMKDGKMDLIMSQGLTATFHLVKK